MYPTARDQSQLVINCKQQQETATYFECHICVSKNTSQIYLNHEKPKFATGHNFILQNEQNYCCYVKIPRSS